MSTSNSFPCSFCTNPSFSAPSHKLLLDHIRLVHSLDPNFSIQCSQPACCRTFKNFRTFQNHLLTHRQEETGTPIVSTGSVDNEDEDQGTTISVTQNYEQTQIVDLKDYAAKWILKTSETRSLTRHASLGIIEDTSFLVTYITQFIKSMLLNLIQSNDPLDQQSVVTKIEELFSSSLVQPFSGLMSFHQQLSYYRTHFHLIVSVSKTDIIIT